MQKNRQAGISTDQTPILSLSNIEIPYQQLKLNVATEHVFKE